MRARLGLLGALSFLAFVLHALNHVTHGRAHDLLWVCNIAPLLLALGCWLRRRFLIAVPVLWLSLGTPLWMLYLSSGGELHASSILTHLFTPALGLLALREVDWPRRAWLLGTLALSAPVLGARVLTPPEANVNLAFGVWRGWERYFPRHDVYLLVIAALSALAFFAIERAVLRLQSRKTVEKGASSSPKRDRHA